MLPPSTDRYTLHKISSQNALFASHGVLWDTEFVQVYIHNAKYTISPDKLQLINDNFTARNNVSL